MKRLIAVALALLIASPAFACGPMTGHMGSSGGGQVKQRKQKRSAEEKRARKQMRELQRNQNVHNNPNYQHNANRELLLESIDMGRGTFSRHSPAETRRRMEDRLGHLLLKYKKKTMTNEEASEAQILIHALTQN
jgi:hypothetical protein